MPTRKNDPDNLTVIGHLDELRKRIIYVLAYLTAGTIAGFYLAKALIRILEIPASAAAQNFILLKPTEVVSIYFKVALYIGVVLSSPAIVYNSWEYVKPAVPKDINISLTGWAASAGFLFCAGSFFSFKILLPAGYTFLMGLSKEIAVPMITLNSYISFALSVIVIGGFIFEMPLISALLTRFRLITPALLKSKRREAIFALCVIAAVVTPTTDVFNMLLFAVPMIALFELSIVVSSVMTGIYIKDGDRDSYGN